MRSQTPRLNDTLFVLFLENVPINCHETFQTTLWTIQPIQMKNLPSVPCPSSPACPSPAGLPLLCVLEPRHTNIECYNVSTDHLTTGCYS